LQSLSIPHRTMASANTADGKWGLSPSIRESIVSSHVTIGKKITSMMRLVVVTALVLMVFLGANFALTVTAVVSNKDVYVNSANGLVDSKGQRLSVTVEEFADSIYDLPYQTARAIADTTILSVADGENRLLLIPSMFEFARGEGGYALSMYTAEGTKVVWGPATDMTSSGVLLRPPIQKQFVSITRADGRTSKTVRGQSRRMAGFRDEALHKTNYGGRVIWYHDKATSITCSSALANSDDGYQHAYGFKPQTIPADGLPLAVYLCGTGQPLVNQGNWGNPLASAMLWKMADLGFFAVNMEYDNHRFAMVCDRDRAPIGWSQKATTIGTCISEICNVKQGDPDTKCSKGVAMYGWSQGGVLALMAHHSSSLVTAALSFDGTIQNFDSHWDDIHDKDMISEMESCYSTMLQGFPTTSRRVLIGATDGIMGGNGETDSGTYGLGDAQKNAGHAAYVTGANCPSATPGEVEMHCLSATGSGYYVVTVDDVGHDSDLAAFLGHWWFATSHTRHDGTFQYNGFQPDFDDETNDAAWGANANFGWLSNTATGTGGH